MGKNKNNYSSHRKRGNSKDANSLIAGRKPVIEALESGTSIAQVYIESTLTGEFEKKIRALTTEKNIPLKRVPASYFAKFGNLNHQSVVAESSPILYKDLDDVLDRLSDLETTTILWLDKIKDVRNLGAIARSAKAFSVDAILLPSKNSAPINSFAIKSSAGTLSSMDVVRFPSQEYVLERLKWFGYQMIIADGSGSEEIEKDTLSSRVCLVMGSEESGVNRELSREGDLYVAIDHDSSVESLNVSVAAGILLHEIYQTKKSS